MWRPESGANPNRSFVLVSEPLWHHYHESRKKIYRDYLGAGMTPESLDCFDVINAAHESLRSEVRALAPHFEGFYLIPV
jgi:hypothetical protein